MIPTAARGGEYVAAEEGHDILILEERAGELFGDQHFFINFATYLGKSAHCDCFAIPKCTQLADWCELVYPLIPAPQPNAAGEGYGGVYIPLEGGSGGEEGMAICIINPQGIRK